MSAQAHTLPRPRSRAVRGQDRPVSWLPRRLRKLVLVVHVAVSVAWLGLSLGLLTLGATALLTSDATLRRSAYLAMNVFGEVLVLPVSLTAFASGLVLALGTKWGLTRHWWVLVKFVLTAVPVVLTIFSLRPGLAAVAEAAVTMSDAELIAEGVGPDGINMVVAPSVASTMYLTSTALSILKPWGRTPWARRRAAARG